MIRYCSYAETFSEVPDEISLYITISNCKIRCPECNSKWLWKDEGIPLTGEQMLNLIKTHKGITCVCIGGGDDFEQLNFLFKLIQENGLKSCWYTGYDIIPKGINLSHLNYIKIGHYNGFPLNHPETNQRFFIIDVESLDDKILRFKQLKDITYRFYDKNT